MSSEDLVRLSDVYYRRPPTVVLFDRRLGQAVGRAGLSAVRHERFNGLWTDQANGEFALYREGAVFILDYPVGSSRKRLVLAPDARIERVSDALRHTSWTIASGTQEQTVHVQFKLAKGLFRRLSDPPEAETCDLLDLLSNDDGTISVYKQGIEYFESAPGTGLN